MSKAFTRESDDEPSLPPPRPVSALPPGAKNYLTPDGANRMQKELARLVEVERPTLAGNTDNPERKHQLQRLDQRIAQLQHLVQTATVLPIPAQPWDQVHFGATVTVRTSAGETETYRIVGADETDLDRNWISYLSPLARALLNAHLGDRVRFKRPAGETQLEITAIVYEAA